MTKRKSMNMFKVSGKIPGITGGKKLGKQKMAKTSTLRATSPMLKKADKMLFK